MYITIKRQAQHNGPRARRQHAPVMWRVHRHRSAERLQNSIRVNHRVSAVHGIDQPEVSVRVKSHPNQTLELTRASARTPNGPYVGPVGAEDPELARLGIEEVDVALSIHLDIADAAEYGRRLAIQSADAKRFIYRPSMERLGGIAYEDSARWKRVHTPGPRAHVIRIAATESQQAGEADGWRRESDV